MPIHPGQSDPETTVVVNSDFGPFTLDLQRLDDVKELIALGKKKPDERDPFSVIVEEYLGGHYLHYTRYWNQNLGRLIKLFSQEFLIEKDWNVMEEFKLQKNRKVNPIFKVVKIPGGKTSNFFTLGSVY